MTKERLILPIAFVIGAVIIGLIVGFILGATYKSYGYDKQEENFNECKLMCETGTGTLESYSDKCLAECVKKYK